jgi:hypothetical protein
MLFWSRSCSVQLTEFRFWILSRQSPNLAISETQSQFQGLGLENLIWLDLEILSSEVVLCDLSEQICICWQQSSMSVWSEDNRASFIRIVLTESRRLGRSEAGFKKTSWTRILTIFNRERGVTYTKSQLQSQLQRLKAKHTIYNNLLNNSGFGVCPVSGRPTAPDDVWDAYVKQHPKAEEFRNKALTKFEELHEIFGTTTATGRFAVSTVPTASSEAAGELSESESIGDDSASTGGSDEACDSGTASISSSDRIPDSSLEAPTLTVRLSRPAPGSPAWSIDSSSAASVVHCESEPPHPKRQRQSTGERISAALEMIATTNKRRAERKAQSQTQTQTQIAISSFLGEYGIGMDPAVRVNFVRYFMNNPSAAEVYNVLDNSTQVAFLSSLEVNELN